MHNTFHVIVPRVNLTLDNRLKVRLHLRACHLDISSQRIGLSLLQLIQILSYDRNLVILNLICGNSLHQLTGRRLVRAELHLHIALTDNLALESGRKCYRNRDLGHFNLDTPEFQRLLYSHGMIGYRFQSARNLILAQIHIYDNREAKSDGACASGYNDLIQRSESIHKGRNSFLGILQKARQIARRQVSKDQRRADSYGHYMNDRGHIVSQRNYTEIKAQLHTAFRALFNHIANHKGHNALALVIFYHIYYVFGIISLSKHYSHTGDIARYQRHAQGTDNGVRNKADSAVLRIRICMVHILQSLDDLSSYRCGKSCVQSFSQIFFVGNQALQNAHTGRQIAELCHLYACGSVNRRQKISRIRHRYLFVFSILCNRLIHSIFRESCHRIGAIVNQIS